MGVGRNVEEAEVALTSDACEEGNGLVDRHVAVRNRPVGVWLKAGAGLADALDKAHPERAALSVVQRAEQVAEGIACRLVGRIDVGNDSSEKSAGVSLVGAEERLGRVG